jgi:magnesium transporter
VRGLATGFVKMGYVKHIFWKEFKVGVAIALSCALASGLCSYFFIERNVRLGVTLGISMLACVVFASMSGTAVPLLLKKAGVDPAISSGPIITTFNDICALIIYFTFATMILL